MSDLQLTAKKLHILRHAIGLGHGRKSSFRNYYQAADGGDAYDALVEMQHIGLVERDDFNSTTFYVTDAGRIAAMHGHVTKHRDIDSRAAWVEAHIMRELTDFQVRAVILLCTAMRRGPYDFQRTFETAEWDMAYGVRFYVYRPHLSTYDTDGLTALVLGAHEMAIRVEINPHTFTQLEISMHPRIREHEHQHGRHPSIEQVLERRKPKETANG